MADVNGDGHTRHLCVRRRLPRRCTAGTCCTSTTATALSPTARRSTASITSATPRRPSSSTTTETGTSTCSCSTTRRTAERAIGNAAQRRHGESARERPALPERWRALHGRQRPGAASATTRGGIRARCRRQRFQLRRLSRPLRRQRFPGERLPLHQQLQRHVHRVDHESDRPHEPILDGCRRGGLQQRRPARHLRRRHAARAPGHPQDVGELRRATISSICSSAPAISRSTSATRCSSIVDGMHFSDIGYLAGVLATDWSWAPLFADLDNDGARISSSRNGIYRRPNDLDYISLRQQRERPGIARRQDHARESGAAARRCRRSRCPTTRSATTAISTFTNMASRGAWRSRASRTAPCTSISNNSGRARSRRQQHQCAGVDLPESRARAERNALPHR